MEKGCPKTARQGAGYCVTCDSEMPLLKLSFSLELEVTLMN